MPPIAVPIPGQMAVPIAAPVVLAVVAAVIPPVMAPTPPQARVAIGLSFTSEDPQLGHFRFLIVIAPLMFMALQAHFCACKAWILMYILSEL